MHGWEHPIDRWLWRWQSQEGHDFDRSLIYFLDTTVPLPAVPLHWSQYGYVSQVSHKLPVWHSSHTRMIRSFFSGTQWLDKGLVLTCQLGKSESSLIIFQREPVTVHLFHGTLWSHLRVKPAEKPETEKGRTATTRRESGQGTHRLSSWIQLCLKSINLGSSQLYQPTFFCVLQQVELNFCYQQPKPKTDVKLYGIRLVHSSAH